MPSPQVNLRMLRGRQRGVLGDTWTRRHSAGFGLLQSATISVLADTAIWVLSVDTTKIQNRNEDIFTS